jgi:hypothetical protein
MLHELLARSAGHAVAPASRGPAALPNEPAIKLLMQRPRGSCRRRPRTHKQRRAFFRKAAAAAAATPSGTETRGAPKAAAAKLGPYLKSALAIAQWRDSVRRRARAAKTASLWRTTGLTIARSTQFAARLRSLQGDEEGPPTPRRPSIPPPRRTLVLARPRRTTFKRQSPKIWDMRFGAADVRVPTRAARAGSNGAMAA